MRLERVRIMKFDSDIRNWPLLRLERDRNNEIQCRAADWNLSSPDWTGRMRVMEKNQKVAKTEDCHAFRAL